MRRRGVIGLAGLIVAAALVTVGLVFRSTSGTAAPGSAEEQNEPIVHYGTTACGVERWWVKTGIDPSARLVDRHHIVSTNISKMRSLPPPASLPARSRIKPVETTVWSETAILVRVQMEADSDYRLVLSDTGGRTMIAEIPLPSRVGSNSPFLPEIAAVRRSFTAKFHPTDQWQRMHALMTIWGGGFFDFKHGQSGVAPNAIELHLVLGSKYGGGVPSTSGAPPPPPPPSSGGSFTVRAWVTPNPVRYGSYATLHAQTKPGASYRASDVCSTGRRPVSFNGSAQTVGSSGNVSWTWHVETKGSGGTASVPCSVGGQSVTRAAVSLLTD